MDAPLADPLAEAARVMDAAASHDVGIRLTGGVAIATISPSALQPPLRRTYNDIDYVGGRGDVPAIEGLFAGLGYHAEEEFNSLHGERRLFFIDRENRREADVFLDNVDACHTLELADRLEIAPRTIPAADLLLSKLQVMKTTQKDFQDAIAVLTDHELVEEDGPTGISLARLEHVCCNDWGWWRTVTMVAEPTLDLARRWSADGGIGPQAADRLAAILGRLDAAPKSRKWKLRARVGERKRWHEEPEDLEHSYG